MKVKYAFPKLTRKICFKKDRNKYLTLSNVSTKKEYILICCGRLQKMLMNEFIPLLYECLHSI